MGYCVKSRKDKSDDFPPSTHSFYPIIFSTQAGDNQGRGTYRQSYISRTNFLYFKTPLKKLSLDMHLKVYHGKSVPMKKYLVGVSLLRLVENWHQWSSPLCSNFGLQSKNIFGVQDLEIKIIWRYKSIKSLFYGFKMEDIDLLYLEKY